jgi:GR25 family glycosyltransferase involved in LPS biosynthesis
MQQVSSLGVDYVRVPAVFSSDIPPNGEPYVAQGVSATWRSHQKAMEMFLASGDEFGLILEDDFILRRSFRIKFQEAVIDNSNSDFIQLGFLINGGIEWFDFVAMSVRDFALKMLHLGRKVPFFNRLGFLNRLLVLEQNLVPWGFILHDIRAGGHAYVVSRKFASAAQVLNKPAFTSTDGVFMYLGNVRTFRMVRRARGIVTQSDSVTSVESRFRNLN